VICTHTLGGRTPHERQKEKKQGPQIAGERSEIWSAIAFTNANVSAAFAFSHSAVESVHILLFFGGLVPIAHPVGRTDGRMTDGQRYGRTDGRRTADGRTSRCFHGVVDAPVANAVYIGFPAWCKNAFNGFWFCFSSELVL